MKRTIVSIIVIAMTVVVFSGCAAILEYERTSERPHIVLPVERPTEKQIEVGSFEELKDAIIEMIMAHETSGRMVAASYDVDDIQSDVDRAIKEIMTYHPIGVFAVSDIVGHATKIVTFFEIDISIEYMRTRQQIEAVISLPYMYLILDEIFGSMSNYREELLFRTALDISVEDVVGYIIDIYYQNPRSIIRKPAVAVEVFPEDGEDRIFMINFEFGLAPGIPQSLGASLALAIQNNIDAVEGETDAERLLSIARNLIAFADFDDFTARTHTEHGLQNPIATAFGALINGTAIGEGFAMAFKALSDELAIETMVVLGTLDGRTHAWNLVRLNGFYYHIDVAMGDVYGLETVFLRSDSAFRTMGYLWNFENTPRAHGILTYADVAGPKPDDPIGEDDINEDDLTEDAGNNEDVMVRPPVRPGANQPRPPIGPGGTPPDLPEEGDAPDAPDESEPPDGSDEPLLPEDPDEPDIPEDPDKPNQPEDE